MPCAGAAFSGPDERESLVKKPAFKTQAKVREESIHKIRDGKILSDERNNHTGLYRLDLREVYIAYVARLCRWTFTVREWCR